MNSKYPVLNIDSYNNALISEINTLQYSENEKALIDNNKIYSSYSNIKRKEPNINYSRSIKNKINGTSKKNIRRSDKIIDDEEPSILFVNTDEVFNQEKSNNEETVKNKKKKTNKKNKLSESFENEIKNTNKSFLEKIERESLLKLPNYSYETEYGLVFNNPTLRKSKESFTYSVSNVRNSIVEEKLNDDNFNQKQLMISEIPDFSLDKKISFSSFKKSQLVDDNANKDLEAKEKYSSKKNIKNIYEFLLEVKNQKNFKIENQIDIFLSTNKKTFEMIQANVNNISLEGQNKSYSELQIFNENDLTLEKTSKADKLKQELNSRINLLEEEVKKKEILLKDAESQRINMHKYIEEFKGNIRVFLRVKGGNENDNNDTQIIPKEIKSKTPIKESKSNNKVQNKSSNKKITNKVPFVNISYNKNNNSKTKLLNSTIQNNTTGKKVNNIKPVEKQPDENENKSILQFSTIKGPQKSIKTIHSIGLINQNNSVQNFLFNYIFNEYSTQSEVFSEVQPLIISALDGENVCLFAYGATGSGKTYTMQGKITSEINDESGILPRAAFLLFEELERRKESGHVLKMQFSAFEIYNENVYDLMDVTKKEKQIFNNTIKGLLYEEINSKEDIIKLVLSAGKSRTTDSTSFNSTSSRSHAVFQLKLIANKISYINIIDLAGCEKSDYNPNTENKDQQKKILTEGNFINNSLTTLGRVIRSIAEKNKQPPYRESKLTQLLQNSFSGDSKLALIVTVANSKDNYSQTSQSLSFARNAMVNL